MHKLMHIKYSLQPIDLVVICISVHTARTKIKNVKCKNGNSNLTHAILTQTQLNS